MILEHVLLHVKQGQHQLFEADFTLASQYIRTIDGYLEHQLFRLHQAENRYLLLVKWENIEAHQIGFRTSEAYQEWKKLLHHYYDPFPVVNYYEEVEL